MFCGGRRAETRVSARVSARSRDFLVKILEENLIRRAKNLAETRVPARVLVLLHRFFRAKTSVNEDARARTRVSARGLRKTS